VIDCGRTCVREGPAEGRGLGLVGVSRRESQRRGGILRLNDDPVVPHLQLNPITGPRRGQGIADEPGFTRKAHDERSRRASGHAEADGSPRQRNIRVRCDSRRTVGSLHSNGYVGTPITAAELSKRALSYAQGREDCDNGDTVHRASSSIEQAGLERPRTGKIIGCLWGGKLQDTPFSRPIQFLDTNVLDWS